MRRILFLSLLICFCEPDAFAKPVDRSHPIEPNGAVRLDIRYGRIRVVGSQTSRVRVSGTVEDELHGISVRDEAGAVEIRAEFGWISRLRALLDGTPPYHVDLLVEIPTDTRLFIVSRDAEIAIDGVDGPIGIGVVSSSVVVRGSPARLDLEAVSGSLDFEGRTGFLSASTLSGDLRAVGGEGEIRLEAATGSLEVLDARPRHASLTTVSGSITVRGSIVPEGLLEVRTESGDVTLACRGSHGIELDLETRDGEILNGISSAKPIRDDKGRRVLRMELDGGGAAARVRTRSGLIQLLPRSHSPCVP